MLRRTLLLLAVPVLAAMLTACSGTTTASSVDRFSAAAANSTATSFKLRMEMTYEAGGESGTMTASGAFSETEGELTFDLSSLGGSLPPAAATEMELRYVTEDGHPIMYMRIPFLASMMQGKEWVRLDLETAGKELGVDIGDLLSQSGQNPTETLAMLGAVGDVEEIGPAVVDGVPVTHYRATVDLDEALEQKGISSESIEQLRKALDGGELEVEAWLDEDDLPRRVRMDLPGAAMMGQTFSMTMTMTMSDWGSEVSVSAPPAAEVFDATALATSGSGP